MLLCPVEVKLYKLSGEWKEKSSILLWQIRPLLKWRCLVMNTPPLFEIFSAEEFIASITQLIPEKSFQLVRDNWGESTSEHSQNSPSKHKMARPLWMSHSYIAESVRISTLAS